MGCDIHCYIEFRGKKKVHDDWSKKWSSFGGRINPGRHYELFTRLSGVRGYTDIPIANFGLPEDISWSVEHDNQLYIDYNGDAGVRGYFSSVTPENAEGWVNSRKSRYIKNSLKLGAEEGKNTHVTNPDWHSHGWVTPELLSKALRGISTPEWKATLAAMKSLEKSNLEVRMVFWYDN
jgi:hypothetical protein